MYVCMYVLIIDSICPLLLKPSCLMKWLRLMTDLPNVQNTKWRLSIGSATFWQIHAQKKPLLYSALRLTFRISGIKKINVKKKLFTKQISTGCRPVSDLWSEAMQLNQGRPKENLRSNLIKYGIPEQRPYRLLLTLLFHCIFHNAICFFL